MAVKRSLPLQRGGSFDCIEHIKLTILDCVYNEPQTGRSLYKVLNTSDGLFYALKVYDLSLNDPGAIRGEMQSMNKLLQRPDLFPRARHYMEADNLGFLRLDWMEGKTLHDIYPAPPAGPLELALRLQTLATLCATLTIVHDSRLVHRDIKPQNIVLRNPKQPQSGVMLIDFGLACARRQQTEGSSLYQAPEQSGHRHFNLTHAVDIFALGQVGWWLFTGAPLTLYPNEEYSDWDNLEDIQLSDSSDVLSKKAYAIARKALAFQPAKRWARAADMGYQIKQLLDEQRRAAGPR